jgi:DNA-binding LacI/PurR family transcriptional regulator
LKVWRKLYFRRFILSLRKCAKKYLIISEMTRRLKIESPSLRRPVRLAFLFDPDFAYAAEVYRGVCEASAGQWRVAPIHTSQESVLRRLVAAGDMDGVIGSFMSDRWLEPWLELKVPIVNLSTVSRIRSVSSVVPDDEATGRLLASHLAAQGVRALVFIGRVGDAGMADKERGFRAAARAAGCRVETRLVSVQEPPEPDWMWREWFQKLKVPAGFGCADDRLARYMIGRVRGGGLQVPQDVAVAGVGDHPLESVLAGMPISSVVLPAFAIGRAAAACMARLLDGDPAVSLQQVAPARMAARESSVRHVAGGSLVARALAWMEGRGAQSCPVRELARALHASPRLLQLRFKEELGYGPREAQARRGMELAVRLLVEERLRPVDVAVRCGFASVHAFAHTFRRRMGCAPGQYARRHRLDGDARRPRSR